MLKVCNDNYSDVLIYLNSIIDDINTKTNFYYEDLSEKELKNILKDCKGAIQYLRGSKADNKFLIVLGEDIKKSVKNKAMKELDAYYKDSEAEIISNMEPILNLDLPKTKRRYLVTETGKYVGYTRARNLGLI